MPETTLIRDDFYEEMASEYQCILIHLLNTTLKEQGIGDLETRRAVCEKFLFGMSNFHDQYWMESDGNRVYPMLCFSSEFLDSDTDVNQLGKVHAPSEMFELHEHAFGNVAWYFDDNDESASELAFGMVRDNGQSIG